MARKTAATDNHASSQSQSQSQSQTMRLLSEEEVLQPAPWGISTDDWPIYLLKDAVVYSKDGKTPANLLHAELEGPFSIHGKLEVDKEHNHLRILKERDCRGCRVVVKDVRGFSIGDGPITIWAPGKAGWFEIQPAPVYQGIFDKTTEAVDLFYSLSDIHSDAKKQLKGKNRKALDVEQVFEKYIQQNGGNITPNKLKKRCAEHAKFLMSQMKNPSTAEMNWPNTSFYKWLTEYSPDIYQLYKPVVAPASQGSQQRQGSTSKTREHSRLGTAAIIVNYMNDLHNSGRLRIPRMNMRSLARNLYERFDITEEELAKEIIQTHAKKIYDALGDEWSVSPIYQKLELILCGPRKVKQSDLQKEALNLVLKVRDDINQDGDMEDQSRHSSSPRSKRKSSQRDVIDLSPSPQPTPRTGGKGAGKGAGKAAGLRLKGTPVQRQLKRSPTPSDEKSDVRVSKRQRTGPGTRQEESTEEDVDMEEPDEEAEEVEDDEEEPPVADLPDINPQQLQLKSVPLPSASPSGPNGLWTCHKESCGVTVPNADEPEGRKKVQSHFLWHADEIAARENLVMQAQRPYLPVGNLLEKLRRLGEEARKMEEERSVGGRVVPLPVKRSLAT